MELGKYEFFYMKHITIQNIYIDYPVLPLRNLCTLKITSVSFKSSELDGSGEICKLLIVLGTSVQSIQRLKLTQEFNKLT